MSVKMRKTLRGFFAALTAAVLTLTAVAAAPMVITAAAGDIAAAPAVSDLYATAAVLLDADSGRVLYSKNGDAQLPMASTTKLMTCILALEEGCLDETAEVSAYAASQPKVKLYARQGEQYLVRDLLYAMMLESYNDAAVVLAEHIGRAHLLADDLELAQKPVSEYTAEESQKAVKAFARLMNEKAAAIGCEQTWFITPNGLDATETFTFPTGESIQKEHSTTAAELARILAYCTNHSPQREQFREITGTMSYAFSANGRSFSCANHNAFLTMMDGAFSGKTGFTGRAGYCYVGALERDGRTFIVALLACGWPNNKTYKWSDTRQLMTYGLENYFYRSFLDEGTAFDVSDLTALPVERGAADTLGETAVAELYLPTREENADAAGEKAPAAGVTGLLLRADEEIEVAVSLPERLIAPVMPDTQVGAVTYRVDGEVYYTEPIYTVNAVEKIDFAWCIRQILERYLCL